MFGGRSLPLGLLYARPHAHKKTLLPALRPTAAVPCLVVEQPLDVSEAAAMGIVVWTPSVCVDAAALRGAKIDPAGGGKKRKNDGDVCRDRGSGGDGRAEGK